MAGYSGTPLTKKIGAKPGARALVVNGPPDAPELFADGVQVLKRAGGAPLDAIVVFAVERRDLERRLPRLRERLDPAGMPWGAGRDRVGRVQGQTLDGSGFVDTKGRKARLRLTLPGTGELQTIYADRIIYLRFPKKLAGQIPGAKQWIKIDLERFGKAKGIDF